ncbi:MAG: PEGA domain-containing protein [Prevotella sp.]|nr:PEGA domain-containing protein [Prevotella sp.]
MKHFCKKYIVLAIAWMCAIIGTAQELKMVSFEEDRNDLTARSTAVKDGNGDVCALIKVSLPVPDCEFDGNIVGKPEFRTSEYWVYMTPSSKKLIVRCLGRESLNVDFGTSVKSMVTYHLKLSGYPDIAGSNVTADPGGNYLILDITPKTGLVVEVDGQVKPVEDGQMTDFFKYGTHRYIVKAEGYAPKEGTVTIGRGETTTVTIALESVMGTLSIRPTTGGATIKINGQTKGTGNWQGQLAPGIYRVDVEKKGYRSYSETVELAQRDNRTVSVPALTPIYGALNIGYKPIGSSIVIDGKTVGTTPSVISNVLIGRHSITISKEGYAPFNTSVDIAEGETTQLAGSLQASQTNVSTLSTTGTSGTINGHEYVDLGLPSGLKWATCNVGASSPSDYGNYYAWGETTPKSEYTTTNCKTWNKTIGDISGNPQYDAACANWGGSWRLPSKAECEELSSKCTWTWTTQGGHNGYKVTGPNGKSIFLPAAGCRLGSSLGSAGDDGSYWSSTPYESTTQGAYDLYFSSSLRNVDWVDRGFGRSVRPVSD